MHGNIPEITYAYAHARMSKKGSFKAKPGSTFPLEELLP